MPTPEQIQAYQSAKQNGELDSLKPEVRQSLAATYEPLVGGQINETVTSKLSGLTKDVVTQYPFAPPGMTANQPIQNSFKRGLYGLFGLPNSEEIPPQVTHTIEGEPSLRKEMVNSADKVINFMARGTGVPFLSEKTNKAINFVARETGMPWLSEHVHSPDLYNALNSLTGQTKSEMDNAPALQSFAAELPGNIIGGEVAAMIAGPIAGAFATTKIGAPTIKAVAQTLPTFTKAAKFLAPEIAGQVEKGLARQAQIASQTVGEFVDSVGGKITDKVVQAAKNQGFPVTDKASLQKLIDLDMAAKDLGHRGIVRTSAMNPAELDQYMAEKFNFIPSKGKAAAAEILNTPTDQEIMQKVGQQINDASGTGTPDMTKFQAISSEARGGAPTADKVGSLNINQIPTNQEDFRGWVQQMVDPNLELMQSARLKGQGALTYEEATQMADNLGMNLGHFSKREMGQAWAPHEAAFLQETMRNKVYPDLIALRDKIDLADPKQKELWFSELGKAFATQANLVGGRAEAARTVAFAKQVSPLDRLRESAAKIFEKNMQDPKSQKRILEMAGNLDLNDPESIGSFIHSLGKSNWQKMTDASFELWVNSILSNPITHAKNLVGNTFTTATVPVEKAAAGLWDAALTKAGNLFGKNMTRDRFVGEAVDTISGQAHGLSQGTLDFFKSLAGEESRIAGAPKMNIDSRIPAIPGKAGKAIRIPGTALRAEDDFFKSINSSGEMYSQAYRTATKEGLKGAEKADRIASLIADPTNEMVKAAEQAAKVGTFTNELGPIGKSLSYIIREVPGLRYVQPFMNTGANILKYGLKRTPLGLTQLSTKLPKGEVADILGQVTMGTGALLGAGGGIGALEKIGSKKAYRPASQPDAKSAAAWTFATGGLAKIYADGGMTGAPPTDPEERKVWYSSGKIPYAVRIGDKWVSYKDLGPAGITLGVMADAMNAWNMIEHEDGAEALGMMMANSAKTYLNQSYTSGLSDLANAYADPKTYGSRLINRLAQGFVPFSGTLKYIGNIVDPTMRMPENTGQALKYVFPFFKNDIPPLYDVWGNEVKFYGGPLQQAVSPIRMSNVSHDKATQEIDRLGIQPGSIKRTVDKNLEMNSPAYYIAQQMRGQYAKMMADSVVNRPAYDKLDDISKTKTMDFIFQKASQYTNINLGTAVTSKAMKLLMQQLDKAEQDGDEGKINQAKETMRALVSRQITSKLPVSKQPFTVAPLQSKRNIE